MTWHNIEADALYLRLDDSTIVESEEAASRVVFETLHQSQSFHPPIRDCITTKPPPRT